MDCFVLKYFILFPVTPAPRNRESFLQGSVFLNVISHCGMSLFWVFMELDHEFIQKPKLMKKTPLIKHCVFVEARGSCPHQATLPAY